MDLNQLFEKLWHDYTTQNPDAAKIYQSFTDEGEQVVNDHIAFRTYNDPRINIDRLSSVFKSKGYEERGKYEFTEKKLNARHYELPGNPDAPRVFISELKLEAFSPFLQQTINNHIDKLDDSTLSNEELIVSGNPWGTPLYDTYLKLREESEYAAWLYVYGFRANHFTVSVNHLKKYTSLEKVNEFLKSHGFKLNSSGGEIKGSPAELLEQSSTMANIIPISFVDGTFNIPSCYYEFARRYTDENGKLYSGFIAKSADKIFESTDSSDK
jgi:hypothetical protein